MAIRTVVWGENIHEQINETVAQVYPLTMHVTIANALNADKGISATTATLQEEDHGLSEARLAETDVLVWWGHKDHGAVKDEIVEYFELEYEEMYGEQFAVPEPLETVFISWFQGGEVFRSGLTYRRGAGNIFYFRPGHETYPSYHDANVHKVLRNSVKWAYNPQNRQKSIHDAPNVPVDKALETIVERGPKLHQAGEAGYR